MLKIKTLLGEKISSPEQALKLKNIVLQIAVISEEFWNHPLAEEILDQFPELNIPDVPKSRPFMIRSVSKAGHLISDEFDFRKHLLDAHWMRKTGIECPYCRSHGDNSYCSTDGVCRYTDWVIRSINEKPTRAILSHVVSRSISRSPQACLEPVLEKDNALHNIRYRDNFFRVIVNGRIIDWKFPMYMIAEISDNMMFPWNNPWLSTAEKWCWKNIELFRKRIRDKIAKYPHRYAKKDAIAMKHVIRVLCNDLLTVPQHKIPARGIDSFIDFVINEYPSVFEESLAEFNPDIPDGPECSWKNPYTRKDLIKILVING